MKCASDFRRTARDALSGRWLTAVIAGLVAALLGGVSSSGPEVNVTVNDSGANAALNFGEFNVYSTEVGVNPAIGAFLAGIAGYFVIAVIAIAVVFLILGSVVQLGYSRFNLDLVDRKREPGLNTLFAYFPHWKTAVAAGLLQTLYVCLWMLLFIIPGIIATYSYAMTPYILADHPEMTASDAIRYSKEMMSGNRWRLFCLEFSFIGWSILCALTLGIGNLWLTPYRQAATAAFYREVSGTEIAGFAAEANIQ